MPFKKSLDTAKMGGKHQYTVTLGVVPDMIFDGKGMRIETVVDGKTAFKAGLLAGDIVLKIGDNAVSDMKTYMQALGKFHKGDKTKVTIKRGEVMMEKDVEF